MNLAHRVAARYARRQPKLEVHKESTGVVVNLIDPEEGEIGYIFLNDLAKRSGHRLNMDCDYNVETLMREVFGDLREVPVYYVSDVHLQDDYKNQRLGLKMYEAAFKAIRPAMLVSGACVSMGTSPEAARVWSSLARKYPSMGDSPRDSVLAIK